VKDEKPDRIPTVAAVMTPFPWVVEQSEPLSSVKQMMIRRHFRHVPVVEDGTLIGVVTDRDIHIAESSTADPEARASLRVNDALMRDAYVVGIHEPVDTVLDEMASRHIGFALVVKDGRLAGIFTASDACTRFAEFLRRMFPADDGNDVA
jgi:acetoin utilization protein AcuB